MKYSPNEDLFKDTTMTFGEHLEELRRCLFLAVIGLVIGVIIGLAVGRWVVEFIQLPLTDALTEYYQKQALSRFEILSDDMGKQGLALPYTAESFEKMVMEEELLPEVVWVDPKAVPGASLPPPSASAAKNALATGPRRAGLVPLFFWRPAAESDKLRPTALNAQEPFFIWMKASVVAGIVFSSPWVFYQLWIFVAAGLYPHEKHYVYIFLPFSLGLFLAGAFLAFFWVFQPVLKFLLEFNSWLGIETEPRISEWMDFALMLPLGFGISFQLPLVMLFLERIGIFTVKAYLEKWRIAIFVIVVLSAVLTPADPNSIFLMAIPLVFLYFGGVALCHYLPSGNRERPVRA
ncbi:MAG: twin-arginine translocase subunit TatC [Pirellulales bacterium]|nr:twin-arginine translocase subunit TatC [Pirellulales bacterium]